MARGLNKVMLIGNLGQDAETRYTPGGAAVTNMRLATARSYKDQQSGEWKEETDWHDVVLWRGENVSQYLTKGTQIYVEGRLQTRSWEDQNGQKRYRTEVVCNGSDLMLLGGRGGGAAAGGGGGGREDFDQRPTQARRASGGGGGSAPPRGDDGGMGVDDDDVPF